jgi:hypothetical protein
MIDKKPQLSNVISVLGPEAMVMLELYGDDKKEGVQLDLTDDAAWLAGYGVLLPGETIASAEEISGVLAVDLGDNDRIMWVDGGRDLNEHEFGQAVYSGLMCVLRDPDLSAEWKARANKRVLAKRDVNMQAVMALGLISDKKLDKKRKEFGRRSARDLMSSTSVEDSDLLAAWVLKQLDPQSIWRDTPL